MKVVTNFHQTFNCCHLPSDDNEKSIKFLCKNEGLGVLKNQFSN